MTFIVIIAAVIISLFCILLRNVLRPRVFAFIAGLLIASFLILNSNDDFMFSRFFLAFGILFTFVPSFHKVDHPVRTYLTFEVLAHLIYLVISRMYFREHPLFALLVFYLPVMAGCVILGLLALYLVFLPSGRRFSSKKLRNKMNFKNNAAAKKEQTANMLKKWRLNNLSEAMQGMQRIVDGQMLLDTKNGRLLVAEQTKFRKYKAADYTPFDLKALHALEVHVLSRHIECYEVFVPDGYHPNEETAQKKIDRHIAKGYSPHKGGNVLHGMFLQLYFDNYPDDTFTMDLLDAEENLASEDLDIAEETTKKRMAPMVEVILDAMLAMKRRVTDESETEILDHGESRSVEEVGVEDVKGWDEGLQREVVLYTTAPTGHTYSRTLWKENHAHRRLTFPK